MMTPHHIAVGDTRLCVSTAGAGVPLLLLHAFPLDHAMWQRQMPLAEHLRLIVPDQRGFGGSGDSLPESIEQLAADAVALLDAHTARWPDEFTFTFAAARQLFDAKRLPEAEVRARKALGVSWGDQRLRASALLAKILVARGQKPEAALGIEAALPDVPAPAADVDVRTHRYRKDLEALRAEIRAK